MEERQNHTPMNAESESEKIIERTLTGKARMSAYKDRIAETERVKERRRARVGRDQEMCLWSRWRMPGLAHDNQRTPNAHI